MKVVCAWCQQELTDSPSQNEGPEFEVSHGICKTCKAYFFADERATLDRFLNKLAAPVLMVNEDGTVLLANDKALRILDKDLSQVRNLKGGDVMECVYARLPEGCGHTTHCVACTIRVNVRKTFETGKSLKAVLAYLNVHGQGGIKKLDFLISTERVDNTVLLRIDEIRENS